MLAAVLLSVLGVSDDDIAADYALSRAAMRELAEWVRTERPESYETMAAQPPAFLDAPPLAMRRFLARARSQYGSLTDYVSGVRPRRRRVDALRSTLLGRAATLRSRGARGLAAVRSGIACAHTIWRSSSTAPQSASTLASSDVSDSDGRAAPAALSAAASCS